MFIVPQIDLPPLTINEERRKQISRSFRRTRGRYRTFRSRLSQEISKTNVLPKELQQRLIAELDKRLDVDLDELLSSPKLRVKLSPAKLDKLLLELYDSVTQGDSGDVFRVIGGGANVGRQNLYLKQQQSKLDGKALDPVSMVDAVGESTPTSLVKRALKRNLPQKQPGHGLQIKSPRGSHDREAPKMELVGRQNRYDSSWGVRLVPQGGFTQSLPRSYKYTPLV